MDREVLTDRGGSGGADRRKAEWISTEDRKRESSVLRQGEKEREREIERLLQERDRLMHARWVCLPRTLEQGITALDETGRLEGESMSAQDG